MSEKICGDRGPDYGPSGVPACGLGPGHGGDDHVGDPRDGWVDVKWSTQLGGNVIDLASERSRRGRR